MVATAASAERSVNSVATCCSHSACRSTDSAAGATLASLCCCCRALLLTELDEDRVRHARKCFLVLGNATACCALRRWANMLVGCILRFVTGNVRVDLDDYHAVE